MVAMCLFHSHAAYCAAALAVYYPVGLSLHLVLGLVYSIARRQLGGLVNKLTADSSDKRQKGAYVRYRCTLGAHACCRAASSSALAGVGQLVWGACPVALGAASIDIISGDRACAGSLLAMSDVLL